MEFTDGIGKVSMRFHNYEHGFMVLVECSDRGFLSCPLSSPVASEELKASSVGAAEGGLL